MADLIQDEIDEYDETVCPYNPEHRFLTKDLFRTHIPTCRDREQQLTLACDYDVNHIFSNRANLNYHMARCLCHNFRIHF